MTDHEGGAADAANNTGDWQATHDALLSVAQAADEHFGGREPTEEEMRGFLRDRLLAEGYSDEQADKILEDL